MSNLCECAICKNELPFEMPTEVLRSLLDGDLVLFAGAGISTENNLIFKETLYQDVSSDLELDKDHGLSFPDLMSEFCNSQINGRQKLLEKIKYRFDYCHQFNELYRAASRFHTELAPFWMLNNIVTTNWDDYFETKCGAIPFVTAEDFAFYNIDQRKVFKIHGSISNYGSIIATSEDYEKCYEELNKGIIGARLKTLLATKTILFVGYSFRDFDFLRILNFLKQELKAVLPHIFIVTLDADTPTRIDGIKHTIINTDGRYFFSHLRKHLEAKRVIFPKEKMDMVYEVEYLRSFAHDIITKTESQSPKKIFCAFYQDGLQHAIDYLKFKMIAGDAYSPHHLISVIDHYEKSIKKPLAKNKNYSDLSYVEGFIEGLKIPFYEDEGDVGMYFVFGVGPTNDEDIVREAFIEDKIFHKASETHGNKHFKNMLQTPGIVAHHVPFF